MCPRHDGDGHSASAESDVAPLSSPGVSPGDAALCPERRRGIAVHEVARIADAAAPDEILVSSVTRALAGSTGLQFDDRGPRRLKGLSDEVVLYVYVE